MINHVETFNSRIAIVRDWKAKKKVKMTPENIRRCARELGLSSVAVKDCLKAIESRKNRERKESANVGHN